MLRKSYYTLLFATALLSLLPLFSCSINEEEQPGNAIPVTIRDNSYNPQTVNIRAGQLVLWENEGSNPHTVSSGSPTNNPGALFESGTILQYGGFQFTFTEPGTYNYFCRIHGTMMTGVVNVQ